MVTGGALIGRERELAELERRLMTARLLTVTGPGGCGKTRVALELAARCGCGVEAGSVVVELANVGGAEQVVDALVRAVGARERFGRRPAQVLLELLADRQLLLVLDNCEHLVATVGLVVAELLDAAPGVRVLVTSREPLGLRGESVFCLGPLSLPDLAGGLGAVVRSGAGRLFVDRAAAVDAGFALTPSVARAVERICRELDGLPLALCLAAARVATLTVGEIADGLARRGRLHTALGVDESQRHHSIRASLDWSYQLLAPGERVLLRRLSAFAGGFTTAAAHAIAAHDAGEDEVRGLLDLLEAKGLLLRVPGETVERWALLETVREYASEQLVLEGEQEETADRHLTFFRGFAAKADELLLEPGSPELIDEETANLRRALERAVEHDVCSAVSMVASLMRHWVLAEHFEEGQAASGAVLSATGGGGEAAARAVVHCGAGLIGMLGEDYANAVANTRAGLALLAGVDEVDVQARCLLMSALVLTQTGLDLEQGRRNAHRAVELARECGDSLGLAWGLANLAMVEATCDRFDAATAAYDEFVTITDESRHPRMRTWAELGAAWTEVIAGSPKRGLAHADLALALEGDWPSMTHFQGAGFRIHALALMGRADDALGEGARELGWAQETGALQAIPALELALVVTELVRGDLAAAEPRARGLLKVPQLHTHALIREVLGRIGLARGDPGEAEAQARELEAIAERTGSGRHRALAQFITGCAAVLAGETDRGRDLLQATLATDAELGLEREAAEVLDALASLAADAGDKARAARLAGAASAERGRLGLAAPSSMPGRLAAARGESIDCAEAWNGAWAEGERLSLADAIAYAHRRRGRRDRPPVGWGSLTPAELDVAALATSGLSNPQIAARLFISRATVKMHLSSVYLKLHVANRTELATAMATHSARANERVGI